MCSGVKLEDDDKGFLLLCSLPMTYDLLITTLLIGNKPVSYDEVVSILHTNEEKEKTGKLFRSLLHSRSEKPATTSLQLPTPQQVQEPAPCDLKLLQEGGVKEC